MLGEIVMTLAAKIATGVAAPLITAVIVVEGLGKGFGNTWNGPQWMVARISCVRIDKLEGFGKDAVQAFIKSHGKTPLSIKVQDNKIVEVNGTAVAIDEGSKDTETSAVQPKPSASGAIAAVPAVAEGEKEIVEEESVGKDGDVDAEVEKSSEQVNSKTKEYKGWAAVWKWYRLSSYNEE